MAVIRFERNAMVSAAHLSDRTMVYCGIPGGTPRLQTICEDGSYASTGITDAPVCMTHKEFVAFVNQRFGEGSSEP